MVSSRSLTAISEADYDVIEGAVMETARGRWFLSEYARRNRHADTSMLLDALGRIETVVAGERHSTGLERLKGDLMEMARAIARTKAEIAALRSPEEDQGRLGAASNTLDGIVRQTEQATSDILEAAEQIQETAWTLRESGEDDRLCDELDRRATQIYTACSFQDLTAQRTGRIVATMRYLETRLAAMIEIWGDDGAHEGSEPPPAPVAASDLSQSDIDLVINTAPPRAERVSTASEEPAADEPGRDEGEDDVVFAEAEPDVAEPDVAEPDVAEPDVAASAMEDDAYIIDDLPPAALPAGRMSAFITPMPAAMPLATAFDDLDLLSVEEKLRRFT